EGWGREGGEGEGAEPRLAGRPDQACRRSPHPMRPRASAALVGAAVALAGCTRIVPRPGFDAVTDLVSARSPGRTIQWNQRTPEDEEAARHVQELLANELDIDSAVQ